MLLLCARNNKVYYTFYWFYLALYRLLYEPLSLIGLYGKGKWQHTQFFSSLGILAKLYIKRKDQDVEKSDRDCRISFDRPQCYQNLVITLLL